MRIERVEGFHEIKIIPSIPSYEYVACSNWFPVYKTPMSVCDNERVLIRSTLHLPCGIRKHRFLHSETTVLGVAVHNSVAPRHA